MADVPDFMQDHLAALAEAAANATCRVSKPKREVLDADYNAPPNPWEKKEADAIELRRQDRDRKKNESFVMVDRSAMSLEEAAIHPTASELRVATVTSGYKRTMIKGGELECILGIAREYANQDDVEVAEKRKSAQGADIYHFRGACPFCKERHERTWCAINQDRFPDTTLLQCMKTGARRIVQHWPF